MMSNDIQAFGGAPDGATDTLPAILLASASLAPGVPIAFTPGTGQNATYKLSNLEANQLNGMVFDVTPGVSISLPTSSYAAIRGLTVLRPTRLWFADIGCEYILQPIDYIQRDKTAFIGKGDLRNQQLIPVLPNAAHLSYRSVVVNADLVSIDSPTFTDANVYSYAKKTPGKWYGGFIALKRGETYRVALSVVGNGKFGLAIRHAAGYSLITADTESPSAPLKRQVKRTGQMSVALSDLPFSGEGTRTNYSPFLSGWSVTIVDCDTVLVSFNGKAITTPFHSSSLGDVFEVGFVWSPADTSSSCSFWSPLIEVNDDPIGRAEIPELRVYGDSTSDTLPGVWHAIARDMLDHTFGVKLTKVTNYAVSGTNSYDVLQSLRMNGVGDATYVVIGIGTNDIQSGATPDQTATNVIAAINIIVSAGRVPVIVLPYMWYGQDQAIPGRGQAATNYDKGALIRARIARICAEAKGILVDPCAELAEPKPEYVTTDKDNDPLLRDNIHQSQLGYKLYAWAISRAIASHHLRFVNNRTYRCQIPKEWLHGGWWAGSGLAVTIDGQNVVRLTGNIGCVGATIAVGSSFLTLPRWARPSMPVSFPCSCDGLGNIAIVRVDEIGEVSLSTAPQGMNYIDLNTVAYPAG